MKITPIDNSVASQQNWRQRVICDLLLLREVDFLQGFEMSFFETV